MTVDKVQRGESPAAAALRPSYAAAVGKGALVVGIMVTGLVGIGNNWDLHAQQFRIIIFAILVGALAGFVLTAHERKEFATITALGYGLLGGLVGLFLFFVAVAFIDIGAWLLALPQPITDLPSWKWPVGFGILLGGLNAVCVLREQRQFFSYSDMATGIAISAACAVLLYLIVCWNGPTPERSQIVSEFVIPALLLGALPGGVAGVLVLAMYRLWRKRTRVADRVSGLEALSEVGTAAGDTLSKMIAFVKGLLWFTLCAVLIVVGRWSLSIASSLLLWKIIGWCAFGGGVLALLKALSEIGPVFRRPPKPENQGVYGRAGDATPEEAEQHSRSSGPHYSPVDNRHF